MLMLQQISDGKSAVRKCYRQMIYAEQRFEPAALCPHKEGQRR